jgi:hypothetical protein
MHKPEISTVLFHIKFTDEDSSVTCYAVSTGKFTSRQGVTYQRLESSSAPQ